MTNINKISEYQVGNMFHKCGTSCEGAEESLLQSGSQDTSNLIHAVWELGELPYSRYDPSQGLSPFMMAEDEELMLFSVYGLEAFDIYNDEDQERNDRLNQLTMRSNYNKMVKCEVYR